MFRLKRAPPQIIDAEFEVVRGPYRIGDQHRRHKGWYFIGRYDEDGWPLFMRPPNHRATRIANGIAFTILSAMGLMLVAMAVSGLFQG